MVSAQGPVAYELEPASSACSAFRLPRVRAVDGESGHLIDERLSAGPLLFGAVEHPITVYRNRKYESKHQSGHDGRIKGVKTPVVALALNDRLEPLKDGPELGPGRSITGDCALAGASAHHLLDQPPVGRQDVVDTAVELPGFVDVASHAAWAFRPIGDVVGHECVEGGQHRLFE